LAFRPFSPGRAAPPPKVDNAIVHGPWGCIDYFPGNLSLRYFGKPIV
jgi:hypothetical protein